MLADRQLNSEGIPVRSPLAVPRIVKDLIVHVWCETKEPYLKSRSSHSLLRYLVENV